MAIRPPELAERREVLERYTRLTRWFHAGIYLPVLMVLGTGWWLLVGHEGHPGPAAWLFHMPNTTLRRDMGWAMAALAVAGLILGMRTARTFVTESLRFCARDTRWFLSWPLAALTRRFARHDGHFDPRQRISSPGTGSVRRSMYLGGRLDARVAQCLRPGRLERKRGEGDRRGPR